ncbi:hypothetical protein FPV67DRAFT_1696858 [Lyophyllum atratum]|nr:hypothetical protein FPV67DRAFT_1696858 [Lyophyllum atratum]
MVSALAPFVSTTRDDTKQINGRYYGAHARRGVSKGIYTQMNAGGRRPHVEMLMSGGKLQPFIHDAVVVVNRRGRQTRFHLFVKNHRYLPPNQTVARWGLGVQWTGDIVVMRKGVFEEFVGFKGGDAVEGGYAQRQTETETDLIRTSS